MTCRHQHGSAVRRRRRNSCRIAAVVLVWSVAAAYTVFRLVEMVLTDPADGAASQGTSTAAAASLASAAAASLLSSSSQSGSSATASSMASAAAAAAAAAAEASSTAEEPEFPAVTLCNINPAKGSELVKLNTAQYNVSNAYESLVDFIQHKSITMSSHIPIKVIFESTGHTIADMLKGCQFSNKRKCDEYNFEHSTSLMGRCYTLHPDSPRSPAALQAHGLRERESSDATSVKILLDPQGYDYLLPNEGFVGVTVIIHSPFEPLLVNLDQSLQVGPKFHTTVHVTASSKVNPSPCLSRQDWKLCVDKCFASAMLSKCKCAITDMPYCTLNDLARCGIDITENPGINWLSKCSCGKPCIESDYRIQSVVQTPRSSLLSRLQTIKERDSLARNTDMVEDANLVQQWAFLRETNRTAFATLSRLSGMLSRFNSKFVETLHGLRKLALTWHRRYVQNQHYSEQCAQIVIDVSQALSNMRKKAQEVREFSGSLFFETNFQYPNDDFLFRVVNLFYKYSPENIKAEFDLFDLTRFYQDLTAFEIAYDRFKQNKCSNVETGGTAELRSLEQEDSTIKVLLSNLRSVSQEFIRIFSDIYTHNEVIRQAYPSSKSKIKQTASPNFVALTVKLQMEQKVRSPPTAVRIVQTQAPDRVLFLITSTLSISLFLTLVVHLLSRLRCRSKSAKQAPKGEAGICELHQRSLRGVKAVRPTHRSFHYDDEDRLSCSPGLGEMSSASAAAAAAAAAAASAAAAGSTGTGELRLNLRKPQGNAGESDCALSNNDYDDGWM